MYFAQRGKQRRGSRGRTSPVQTPVRGSSGKGGLSSPVSVDIEKIRWNRSVQFLGSALNAACEENEMKAGYLNMEINGSWASNWFSLSPVPGVGFILRRYVAPVGKFKRIADTFSVSYILIPTHETVKCKVNIIEEMVHVSVELDLPQHDSVAKEFFFLCENSDLSKSWGDAFLKAVALCKSMPFSSAEIGSAKDDIAGNMFLEPGAGGTADFKQREQQRNDEFMLCFLLCSDSKLRQLGTTGGLERSTIRSLCWLHFLHFFPPEAPTTTWPTFIREGRRRYDRCIEKVWSGDGGPPNRAELTAVDDEPFSRLGYERIMDFEIKREIEKDVLRTQNKRAFFRMEKVRAMMTRILLVYALEHPKVGYKQGMNDLVAAMLFLFFRERMEISDANGSVTAAEVETAQRPASKSINHENIDAILHFDFIEHDIYTMLSLMMQRMDAVFCPLGDLPSPRARGMEEGENIATNWFQRSGNVGGWDILARLEWIQNVRLRVEGEMLPIHLLKLGIRPHMYLLPWIRLLFSREFCMEGLWLLWDAIFALSPIDFSFANYISVAMIEGVKSELLQLNDMASALLFLQRPRVRSVFEALKLVQRAKEMWDADQQEEDKETESGMAASPKEDGKRPSGGASEAAEN
jgi:hypothetical protein